MAKKQQYDVKKTIKKGLWSILFVMVAGLLSLATDDPRFLLVVPALEMAKNFIKYKILG